MEPSLLLQRYRSDRRKLLELIFSQGLVKVPLADPPDRSDMQLDNVSADYVLECVKSGGAFVREEAVERYNCGMDMPIMVSVPVGNSFFLLSNPDASGSPPRRVAPLVGEKAKFDHFMYPSMQKGCSVGNGVKVPMSESKIGCSTPTSTLSKPTDDMNKFCLGLPPFLTGLSEDDVRETAYEVFLACVVHSGGQKSYFEDNKKERKSKFLKGLRSRRDGSNSQSDESRSDLMDIIRGQMEISEAMDAWTKKGLRNFCLGSMPSRADVHRIAMELLRTLSASDFPSRKIYRQWQNRQADVLQELLLDPANSVAAEQKMLLNLLSKLRNLEDWINLSNEVRAETLTWIENLFSSTSSMPAKFVVSDATYYCTRSFYFAVKLYLKLLSSIFDVLEDGRIVEEADEILGALRMTWSMLGITQIMHDVLYGWAVFQQFVQTGDLMLLKFTILEIRRIVTYKDGDGDLGFENKTVSSVETFECRRDFSLVDTVLFKIYHWCSTKLEDYHLHFSMGESQIFEGILTLSILSGLRFAYECCETKVPCQSLAYPETDSESGVTSDFVRILVEKSSQAAFKRALGTLDAKSNMEQKHPLIVLAKELKAFAEKEHTSFTPILCRIQPKAGIVFCVLFHQYYGEQLWPYLEGISGFTESAISVLSASYCLERCLAHIIQSTSEVRKSTPITNYVDPYHIREICSPFILDLVNLRHEKILGWTERAILLENWEPLSFQQKQAASVIEVFRMIHEAIDQFFDLIIPMDTIHLRSLLIGIVRSLESYLQQIISQQVDKDCLYPSPSTLTRYKESVNPFLKKKPSEYVCVDEKVVSQMENLTVSKLCVKLNTLHYIRDQLDELETSIKQSWVATKTMDYQIYGGFLEESTSSEFVDELFSVFDDIRANAIEASDVILDFIGSRAIFWDTRHTFLFSLYRGGVKSARLDTFLPELDGILDRICGLIIDELRDQVVLGVCKASMAGYTWVMVDGGPSRAFSYTDVELMHEDLNMLKDLFEANGQGIPHEVVNKEAKEAEEILDLYSMKAEAIIDKLINSSKQLSQLNDCKKPGNRCPNDADTLLRVLCHMKDEYASEFLRVRYQLPKSSDYEEANGHGKEPTSKSPLLTDILKGNSSSGWTETGQRSFRIMKKKFHEAASEFRQSAW